MKFIALSHVLDSMGKIEVHQTYINPSQIAMIEIPTLPEVRAKGVNAYVNLSGCSFSVTETPEQIFKKIKDA